MSSAEGPWRWIPRHVQQRRLTTRVLQPYEPARSDGQGQPRSGRRRAHRPAIVPTHELPRARRSRNLSRLLVRRPRPAAVVRSIEFLPGQRG